jgi:hypothetical protein
MTRPSDPSASPGSAAGPPSLDLEDHRSVPAAAVRRRLPPWLVGVAGLSIGVAIALRILVPSGMDPTALLAFGEDSEQTAYARRLLGDVSTRPFSGHDGKFFFVQANDPWYLQPQEHAVLLDRPIYRGQRMLYPLIAGGLGLFPPRAIVWSMPVTSLLAMAIGAALAAGLASRRDAPAWLGLLVPLNIGLLFEFEIGGAGILAYTCCLAAVYALEKKRTWLAAYFFGAAALTKEVMVAFAIGVLVLMLLENRRHLWRIAVVPVVALSVWHMYLRVRLAGLPDARDGLREFALPFVGIVDAFRVWVEEPTDLLINLAILAVVLLFIPVALRSRLPIVWGALPFVGLATILSAAVWRETFDLTRALTPVFTAVPFAVVVPRSGEPVSTRDTRSQRDQYS